MKTNNNYLEFQLSENLAKYITKVECPDTPSDMDALIKYIEGCWWNIRYNNGSILKGCHLTHFEDGWEVSLTERNGLEKLDLFRFTLSKDLLMSGMVHVINSNYLCLDETDSLINVLGVDVETPRTKYVFNEQAFNELPCIEYDRYILIRVNNRNKMFVLDRVSPDSISLRDKNYQYHSYKPLQFLSGLTTSLDAISSDCIERTAEGLLVPKVTGIYPIGIITDEGEQPPESSDLWDNDAVEVES